MNLDQVIESYKEKVTSLKNDDNPTINKVLSVFSTRDVISKHLENKLKILEEQQLNDLIE
ncbi:MAG: hypothetical protein AAF298_01290 [Cyanobacteria bacterium P01_A01_bin.40]